VAVNACRVGRRWLFAKKRLLKIAVDIGRKGHTGRIPAQFLRISTEVDSCYQFKHLDIHARMIVSCLAELTLVMETTIYEYLFRPRESGPGRDAVTHLGSL
jgi:hypothetical protein